ncbi:MAG: ABC transporter ATP-binding protein/permease [Proteobacteria bacterium]|nr:ABC transporter ATP-binding protein/permease [Pseudomonadota bacterium]
MPKFDRRSWQRLDTLARPFFVGEKRTQALGMLALLLALSLSIKGMDVLMSYVGRDFMTALSLRQRDEFIQNLYRYLGAFALATPLVVFYRYTEERLALMWRRWLSQRLIDRYFSQRAYYKLSWYPGIDNPDQRIEEDVRTFTATSLSLFLIILQAIIALFLFMGVLSSISIYLTIGAVLYAALGSVCTFVLGRPLISLNYAQLKKEADYRYKLINVRDHAESVAFYRGERRESTRVRQRLKAVVANMLNIINRNRLLNFFTTGYNYVTLLLPTIIVSPLYLDGKIEFGVVTQAALAFTQVLNALSIIVLNFGSLSAYAAVVRRLGLFWDALDDIEAPTSAVSTIQTVDAPQIAFKNVTILTPHRDQKLIESLSFALAGKGLFITGASGTGKSSILRSLAGLWNSGDGVIERPALSMSMYVPQRPYMVMGTLRAQLLYGQSRAGFTDRELLELLEKVGLMDTYSRIGGFEASVDWSNILSTGEQQRLAFARVVLARPRYVYLDEATTALDEASEEQLYDLLREFADNWVTVGYRHVLKRMHNYRLLLPGGGAWRFERLR